MAEGKTRLWGQVPDLCFDLIELSDALHAKLQIRAITLNSFAALGTPQTQRAG
jgi:hypothetical protein